MKSVILIYSGGLDSSVLLCKLLAEGNHVRALSVDYGQRHKIELKHASEICEHLGVEHRIADLSTLKPLLAGSSQTDDNVPVPHGHYEEVTMRKTVVPFRNGLMLSVATAWAISTKSDSVAYAAHFGDNCVYPDCREEFCRPFAEAMTRGDWHIVQLERPFLNITKADIVREAVRLGCLNIAAQSYSCYEGKKVPCGVCGTDVERRMAFIEAGVEDNVEYDKPLPVEYVRTAQAANLEYARKLVS